MRYEDGEYNLASGTRAAFAALSAALVAEGLPPFVVTSGDRSYEVQRAIFLARFEPATSEDDVGPYGDCRFWEGQWWHRVSEAGTAAVPGTSNHEQHRSNDLAEPYDAKTDEHARAQQLAEDHDIVCDGQWFINAEYWHWTYQGDLGTIGPAGAGWAGVVAQQEEDEMPKYVQVKDDRGNFAIVGPDGVGRVLSGAALRGAQKIARVANGGGVDDESALPEVELSGEEWDSSTLAAFGSVNVSQHKPSPMQPGVELPPGLNIGPGLAPITNLPAE